MKTTYETFEELADAMVRGEGILHAQNCAQHRGIKGGCIPWQHGVMAFAEWLDHIGVKVEITDGAQGFYNFVAKRKDGET